MEILDFIGTCTSSEIGDFAAKSGKASSWNNAKKAIKKFSPEIYNGLSLDLRTFYEDQTNIKKGKLFSVEGKYLHIIHSATDYIFLIK